MTWQSQPYTGEHGLVDVTLAAAMSSGDVKQLSDGRASTMVGLKAGAISDVRAFDPSFLRWFYALSAQTFALGDQVFWDPVGLSAVDRSLLTAGAYLLGTCQKAKIAGEFRVLVALNEQGKGPKKTEDHTAADTLLATEAGTVHTNTGAGTGVKLTLPTAVAGLGPFTFIVGAAQVFTVGVYTGNTMSATTGVPGSASKGLYASTVQQSLTLFCAVTGNWSVIAYTGTWTPEA